IGTTISQTGNAFASTYANPRAGGLPNGSSFATFGQPLYGTVLSSQQSSRTGSTGGTGLSGGSGSSGLGGLNSSALTSRSRAPLFTAALADFPVAPPHPVVLTRRLP